MKEMSSPSWHGIDGKTLATLVHRFWAVLAGGITVLVIPICLTSVQQGYYFTFSSMLALQIFFELGMGQVVIQLVAHEAAYLHLTKNGYQGEPECLARLCMLQRQLKCWYAPAALMFICIVGGIGLLFFRDGGLPWDNWVPAWLLLVASTGTNLYLSWKLAIIEGFGYIRDIAQLRLWQSVVGYLLMWLALFAGIGILAVILVPLTAVIGTVFWLREPPADSVLHLNAEKKPNKPIGWRKDIFPFQWRIAVSWISGYFIFQLFTPLLFKKVGASEAGSVGLALTIFSAISSISMSWVSARAVSFSMLIAKNESVLLLKEFRFVMKRSVITTFGIVSIVLVAVLVASHLEIKMLNRIASFPVLVWLGLATVVNSVVSAAAVFMRAHKEEPMLLVSITCASLIVLGSLYGIEHGGAYGMVKMYAIVHILIALPWTLLILKSYIKKHSHELI